MPRISACRCVNALQFGTLEVEHADAAVFQQQRDDELGADVLEHFDVSRIFRHVVHDQRHFVLRGVADEPFADLDRQHVRLLAVLQRHFGLELLLRLVDEKDAERPVVDDAFGENRDAAQQLVEIENFGDLAGNLGERLQGIGVVAFLLEQARVRQRLRDVHAELPENLLVALGEGADTIAEQVQRAQHPLLVPQRHDELRVHSGYQPEISRIFVARRLRESVSAPLPPPRQCLARP